MTNSPTTISSIDLNWDEVIKELSFEFSSQTMNMLASRSNFQFEWKYDRSVYRFNSLAELNNYLKIIFPQKNIKASFEINGSQRGILIQMDSSLADFIKSFNSRSIKYAPVDDNSSAFFAAGHEAIPELLTLIELASHMETKKTKATYISPSMPTEGQKGISKASLTHAVQAEISKLKIGSLSFFAINKMKKAQMIEKAWNDVSAIKDSSSMGVEELLNYKKNPNSMSLKEALNYNRLFVHREKTNTLIAVEKAVSQAKIL